MELTQIQHLSLKALWNQRRTTTKYLLLEHYSRYAAYHSDEPTTHLDLLQQSPIFKLLEKTLTQETNKCILFSTHDIDMAIQLSDEMTYDQKL
jgi:iron complex transport system ATP-binding protein